jgi:hypothetical protein
MLDLMILLITAFVPMVDPFIAIGYIVAGLTARAWWMAAAPAAVWTMCVNMLAAQILRSPGAAGFRIGPTLLASMAAALLAVGIFSVRQARHRARASVKAP